MFYQEPKKEKTKLYQSILVCFVAFVMGFYFWHNKNLGSNKIDEPDNVAEIVESETSKITFDSPVTGGNEPLSIADSENDGEALSSEITLLDRSESLKFDEPTYPSIAVNSHYATIVRFVDQDNKPWPIQGAMTGDRENIQLETNLAKEHHLVGIAVTNNNVNTNLVVTLTGKEKPIMLLLSDEMPDDNHIDGIVTYKIDKK